MKLWMWSSKFSIIHGRGDSCMSTLSPLPIPMKMQSPNYINSFHTKKRVATMRIQWSSMNIGKMDSELIVFVNNNRNTQKCPLKVELFENPALMMRNEKGHLQGIEASLIDYLGKAMNFQLYTRQSRPSRMEWLESFTMTELRLFDCLLPAIKCHDWYGRRDWKSKHGNRFRSYYYHSSVQFGFGFW